MSTLATNKLGTLSGSADMSLPSSRPDSTKQGFLDSSGNLTFGQSTVNNIQVMVTDDDGKVGKVLVDQVCSTGSSDATAYNGVKNSSSNGFFGYAVGIHNAPDDIKTNYLFEGNLRSMEIEFQYYVNGNSNIPEYNMYYTPLDLAGNRLWSVNQRSVSQGGAQGYTYENEDSSGSRYNGGNTSYAATGGDNNGLGGDRTYTGNYSGTGKHGKIFWHCGVNTTYFLASHSTSWKFNSSSTSNMFPISESQYTAPTPSGGYTNTERTQGSGGNSSPYGYGLPWTQQGGCFFSAGGYSAAPQMNYFTATCYAYIKPTDLVST
jgi:hypothetical protein